MTIPSTLLFCVSFDSLLWKDNVEVTSSLCSVTHTARRLPSFMKCCSLLILLLLKRLHGVSWFRTWSHVLPLALQCRPQPLICPHTQPSPLCSAVWIPRSASCAFKLAPSAPPSLSLTSRPSRIFPSWPEFYWISKCTLTLFPQKTFLQEMLAVSSQSCSTDCWPSRYETVVPSPARSLALCWTGCEWESLACPSAFTSNLHIGHRFVQPFIVWKCPWIAYLMFVLIL